MTAQPWAAPFVRLFAPQPEGVEPHAQLKTEPEDFQVTEQRIEKFSGSGEHLCLHIEKRGQNTRWVADQLAAQLGLQGKAVGYAGLKDRHAVTRQWFSLPLADENLLKNVQIEGVRLLDSQRHSRKLRPGDLSGNQFALRLRNLEGDREQLQHRLQRVVEQGFPNFFGAQRFGRKGDNVEQALDLNRRRRLLRHRNKGIYLSAARSWMFNRFLADRIECGDWPQLCAAKDITGPLWGRGRPPEDATFAAQEAELPGRFPELANLLEHSGLGQDRRTLRLQPQLQWRVEGNDLHLSFCLPPGSYATALIDQLLIARTADEPQGDENAG